MLEMYGAEALLIESQGFVGISTNTNLVFIGSAPKVWSRQGVTDTQELGPAPAGSFY